MKCHVKQTSCIISLLSRLVRINVLFLCFILIVSSIIVGCSNQTKEIQPANKVSQTIINNKYATKENIFGEKGYRLSVKLPQSIELKPYTLKNEEAIQSQNAFTGTGEGANYFVCIISFKNNAEPSLEQISNNFITSVKALNGVTEFTSSKKAAKISDRDAIIMELKYKAEGQNLSDKAVYIIDGKKFWQVGVQYVVTNETQMMASEVIQSVNVLD
ncbi:hypothetical protein [Phosphitispora sp. TUW77]|uniref:hypothetical protein n=1 Tax=Phosphitispora sp. TUW77 TaxID=3152361 RepID=UPI003AB2EBED